MTESSELSRSELVAEVAELRAEVSRLRDLLGLADRTGDGHQRSWAPTLFRSAGLIAEVTQASPPVENVELIRSLFGARCDVYAQRWENQNTGKSGWSPGVRGGWSNSARKAKDYLPLTDEVLASHLRGAATIGIYPLLRNDTCALLACDFDDGSWALDALAFLDECHAAGVPAVLERSRSGDGGHVWVFLRRADPSEFRCAWGVARWPVVALAAGDRAYRQVRHQPNSWFYDHDAGQRVPNRQGFQFDKNASAFGDEEMSVFLGSGLSACGATVAEVATRGGLTEQGAVFEFPDVASLPDRVELCSAVAASPMGEPASIGSAHASIYRMKLTRPDRDILHNELLQESELCAGYDRPTWEPPPG